VVATVGDTATPDLALPPTVEAGTRVWTLERLRTAPVRLSGPALVRALERVVEVRSLGVGAVLSAPSIETPAHLSLVPSYRRGGGLYDALNAGTMDLEALEALAAAYPLASEPAWYAVDASVWPRCDAETSPERGYYAHPYRHSHGQPIVAGWNYSWLVQVPCRCSSWTAPLRMRRMRPGENLNLVAAEQICSWLTPAAPAPARPAWRSTAHL